MLKLKDLEIVADEGDGSAYLVIFSGDPEVEDEIASLEPREVALAAAYLLRISEEAQD